MNTRMCIVRSMSAQEFCTAGEEGSTREMALGVELIEPGESDEVVSLTLESLGPLGLT